jgi:transcriptional regulator with XRE-family HTH domain
VVRSGRLPKAQSPYREAALILAARVRERRLELKISQEELARRAGITSGVLIRLEQGHTVEPGFFGIVRLMSALELTWEDLSEVWAAVDQISR